MQILSDSSRNSPAPPHNLLENERSVMIGVLPRTLLGDKTRP